MNARALSAAVAAALLLSGCNAKKEDAATAPAAEPATPAVDIAAEEQAINARNGEWMNFMNARDVTSLGGVYAPDAVSIYDGVVQNGSPEIIAGFQKNMGAHPDTVISWSTDSLHVAESGDLAYEIGSIHTDPDGAEGKAPATAGKYITVWAKADGAWHVVADAGTDDVKKPEDGDRHAD
jgi:uncharacterized protein (TIGR02246 family)